MINYNDKGEKIEHSIGWMILQIFWTTITQQQCSKCISISINVIVMVVVGNWWVLQRITIIYCGINLLAYSYISTIVPMVQSTFSRGYISNRNIFFCIRESLSSSIFLFFLFFGDFIDIWMYQNISVFLFIYKTAIAVIVNIK